MIIKVHCDDHIVIFFVNNQTLNEHSKHVEVDHHFILDMVLRGLMSTSSTSDLK